MFCLDSVCFSIVGVTMIRVYLDELHHHVIEIPISETTTCADVVSHCILSVNGRGGHHLTQLWRGHGM